MAYLLGQDYLVQFETATPGTFITIAAQVALSWDEEVTKIEISNKDNVAIGPELRGTKLNRSGSFSFQLKDSSTTSWKAVRTAMLTLSPINMKMLTTKSGAETFAFAALITKAAGGLGNDEVAMCNVDFQVSGAVTATTVA